MTGTLPVISSAYLISRVWGLTGLISFTMIQNSKGPSTVPWGTPLLTLRKLVTSPSTTTLCRRSHRKLIIQFLMYGLMSYNASLLKRMPHYTVQQSNSPLHSPTSVHKFMVSIVLTCIARNVVGTNPDISFHPFLSLG